jgi:hypothetical protein
MVAFVMLLLVALALAAEAILVRGAIVVVASQPPP